MICIVEEPAGYRNWVYVLELGSWHRFLDKLENQMNFLCVESIVKNCSFPVPIKSTSFGINVFKMELKMGNVV